jgi:hypothetical protein
MRTMIAVVALALVCAGCGLFYYGKPGAGAADFRADSTACINDFGIPSKNGQIALVAKEPYKRCMLAKGWTREQRINTDG